MTEHNVFGVKVGTVVGNIDGIVGIAVSSKDGVKVVGSIDRIREGTIVGDCEGLEPQTI